MTFGTMQTEVGDRLSLDVTVTAYATRVQRWINLVIQDICSRWDWKFLQEREIVQTTTQYTTGTVTVTNGSASVVGSGTVFIAGHKRWFIQVQNDTNWYEVTVVTGQTLTVSPVFGGTSAAGSTFVLRQVYYDLTSDVSRVIDVRQSTTPVKLANLGVWTLDLYQPDIQTTAAPTGYILFRNDPDTSASSAKVFQISFFPIPDAVYNMEVRYFKILADLSSSSDISQIPVQFHNVICDGAEWLGSKYNNSQNEPALKQAYEYGVSKMIETDSSFNDFLPVLASTDTQQTSKFLPFPTTFEQPS